MDDFRLALIDYGLNDSGFFVLSYTWEKYVAGRVFVQKRLDRAMAFASWQVLFRPFR